MPKLGRSPHDGQEYECVVVDHAPVDGKVLVEWLEGPKHSTENEREWLFPADVRDAEEGEVIGRGTVDAEGRT